MHRMPPILAHLVDEAPAALQAPAPEVLLADFGRVAFGNLRLECSEPLAGPLVVHFGEALDGGRVLRQPPGTVRYARVELPAGPAGARLVAPAADVRNTTPPAVPTPPEWGVVLPFRWVEIEGAVPPGALRLVRRTAQAASWDTRAASFECADPVLTGIWELCRHTIQATTFASIYVDGDRERIAYEADAYINQVAHYACDPDPRIARNTFDWLMEFPTWPTEWAPHLVFMAHADWWQTGDRQWMGERFDALQAKLLDERLRPDGLVGSTPEQMQRGDLVDWPPGERDGYVFSPVNTVVNAFHLQAHALMAEMAETLGREGDAVRHRARRQVGREALTGASFDRARGIFLDGPGTGHASLHANLFPLAFGLVPREGIAPVLEFIRGKGMACSVYAAHYLLEALFQHGEDALALDLMTAPGDRSWRHMLASGTTLTWEAWDQKYKPNQDWNHAWGAAPAHLLPRHVLGVEPAEPGWKSVRIRPRPGRLLGARGRVPTPHGSVDVSWKRESPADPPELSFQLPPGVRRVE